MAKDKNVFQRVEGGTWYIRYDLPRGSNGRRRQRMEACPGMNQRQAERMRRQRMTEVDNGNYAESGKAKYGDFLDDWIGRLVRIKRSPSTIQGYKKYIKNHIRPELGHYYMSDMNTEIIQSFVDDLIDKGLRPKTVLNIHGAVHASLGHAVKLKKIVYNYADSIMLPEQEDPDISIASTEQLAELLSIAKGTRYWMPCMIALFAGMRKSETIGLQWQDIDMNARTIFINRAVLSIDGETIIKGTKSGKPRLITVSQVLIDALMEHRKMQITKEISTPWVCSKANGDVMNSNTLGSWFWMTKKKLNLSFTLHGLRHTYVTEAISRGATVKAVSDMTGHATEQFTLKQYTHTTPPMQNAVVDAIEHYYNEALTMIEKKG